jgi:two-component system NarL family response regulator
VSEGLRVLLVDDHRLFSQALTVLLRGHDTIREVVAVETAEEAVALCAEHAPDVVLMDLDLPGMDGLDAIDRIAEVSPAARVVVVTAMRKPEFVSRAVQSGAVGFVHKSRAPEELINVIERAAAGAIVISPEDIFSLIATAELDAAGSGADGRGATNQAGPIGAARPDGRATPHGGGEPNVGYGRRAAMDRLTAREVEILRVLAEGKSTDEVAESLFISRLTVQSHVKSILAKLGVHSKLEAVTFALRRGIIDLPRGA